MKKAIGVDISKYDKVFNPNQSIYPLDFVIARAGHSYNGIFYEDIRFRSYFNDISKIPIRLSYIYMDSGTTLDIQVEEFLDSVEQAPFEWHGFACDWEAGYNVISDGFADKGLRWIERIKEATGKPVILYTNRSLYEDYWVSRGKDLPLWLSWPLANNQWTVETIHNKVPRLPDGRTDWLIWQFSYTLPGFDWGLGRANSGLGDMFNGTKEEMRDYFESGGTVPVPPPEEEEKVLINRQLLTELEKEVNNFRELQRQQELLDQQVKESSEKIAADIDNLARTAEGPEEPQPEPELWITLVGLNIRSDPYVGENKVGSIAAGKEITVVELEEKDNGDLWGLMQEGWIALRYQGNTYAERA